jgi:phytoene dehydrogenase-like protein
VKKNRLEYDAVVVGSGPNGLAAAVTIAKAGRSVLLLEAGDSIGGGTRTKELTLPGFLHDVCAAVHPLALASPFFRSLDLAAHGLKWIHPPIPLAHPLDGNEVVLLHQSLQKTADELGLDKDNYLRLLGPLVKDWVKLMDGLLRPLGFPRHPAILLPFGSLAIQSATELCRSRFQGEKARALFGGNSCHAVLPLEYKSTAAYGLMLSILGHAVGWPISQGGSKVISDAIASCLLSLGGKIKTGFPVNSMDDLPIARAVLFDTAPRHLARIAGKKLPDNYRRRLESHKHGPGVFKIDWALDAPIPWENGACLQAGMVHLAGTLEECAASERAVSLGLEPVKPFVLLSQPSLFDSTRAPDKKHTAWAYCHVPNGSKRDMTKCIEDQVERFAPGFRHRILARHTMTANDMENYNPNYIGGDIVGGLQGFFDLFVRPMGRWRAYATPEKGIYLCSSSMPPGGGVHGMCGHLAAKMALQDMT